MSELAKMLTAVSTRRRHLDYPPISAVMDVTEEVLAASTYMPEALEYKVQIELGSKLVARTSEELQYLIPTVKRRIVEHVFGEFRKPIMEVRQALYERDIERCDRLLGKLYNQMFEEGIHDG